MYSKRHLLVGAIAIFTIITFSQCASPSLQEYASGSDLSLDSMVSVIKNDSSHRSEKIKVDSGASSSGTIPTTREELGNMRTVVKIMNGTQSAGLSVPGFGDLKLGKEESSLSVYYIETKVVDTSVYGIGYSVHYLFKKLKRGISVTNLAKVAASVQLESNKSQVVYSQQSYGIKSLSLVNYFKPTVNKDFNVEGFGVMQSSIDGIHNVLSDSVLSSKTKFEPMLLTIVKPRDLQQ